MSSGTFSARINSQGVNFTHPQTWCNYCHNFEELSRQHEGSLEEETRLAICIEHQHIRYVQRQKFTEELKDLEAGKSLYTEIMLMDFTQLQLDNCLFIQDMIMVVYYCNSITGKLQHYYRHFVAEDDSISNDVGFMQACVQKAMQGMLNFCCFELTILTEFSMSEKVCIWSDGGPKHFKNSHALFAAAQIAFKEGVCI